MTISDVILAAIIWMCAGLAYRSVMGIRVHYSLSGLQRVAVVLGMWILWPVLVVWDICQVLRRQR